MDPWSPGIYSFNSSPGDSDVDQHMKARGINFYLKDANFEQSVTTLGWVSLLCSKGTISSQIEIPGKVGEKLVGEYMGEYSVFALYAHLKLVPVFCSFSIKYQVSITCQECRYART